MRVVLEVLTPAVQYRDKVDLGAEVALVSGDGTQRLSCRAERDGIDGRLFWNAIAATGAGTVKTTWK